MKGMAMDKEFLIGLLIVILVFIIGLLFFMKVWTIGGNETSSTQGLSSDCSRWLSESPACRGQEIDVEGKTYRVIPDRYTSLKTVYGSNKLPSTKDEASAQQTAYGQAKSYCNCPN